jgi:hypothetical protein
LSEKIIQGVLLDLFTRFVWIRERLDTMAATHDQLVLLPHILDKVFCIHSHHCLRRTCDSGFIQGATESRPDQKKTISQRRNEILASNATIVLWAPDTADRDRL